MKKIFFIVLFLLPLLLRTDAQTFFTCVNTELHVGIVPTFWKERNNFLATSCNASLVLALPHSIIPLFKMPKFNHLFSIPWQIGAQLHLQADVLKIFIESNYRHSHSKKFSLDNFIIADIDTIFFEMRPSNYTTIDAYFGARYYINWCLAHVFIGAKFGIVHQRPVNFTFVTDSRTVPFPTTFASEQYRLFQKSTSPAGGLQAGIEYYYNNCISLTLTAEINATCGPRGNTIPFDFGTQSVFINPLLGPNNFMTGTIGIQIFCPLSVGFKYIF